MVSRSEHLSLGPCIGGVLFDLAMIMIYISANSYIVHGFSNYAASALATKTLMRPEVSAMVPLFITPMFHNMGFQYAGLLLALISVAIAPVFFKFGGNIWLRSMRATLAQGGGGYVGGPEKVDAR